MIIIGIVISVILSAVVSIVVRQLDKNESQMEKVKRYADARRKEFDDYFNQQIESQKFIINDLETKKIETEAAISRMEDQIRECKDTTESFEDPVRAVENIQAKIQSYDNVIKNLMEMTAAVEQNLASVKNEAVLIDKVNARLNKQQKAAEILESKVGELVKQFSAKNAEQLKTIGEDLLKERAQEVEGTTETARKQNEAIMKKIEDDIRNAYSAAIENAKKLEDESFSNLRQESQNRIDECLNEINVQAKQITAMIDSKIEETQKALNVKSKELTDSFKEYSSGIENKFKERTENMQQMLDARTNVLSDNWEKKISSLEADLKERSENFDSILDTSTDSIRNKIELKIADIENDVDSRTGNIEGTLSSKIDEIAARVNETTDSITNEIAEKIGDIRSDLENNTYEISEKCNSAIAEFKSNLENSTAGIEERIDGRMKN